MIRLLSAEQLKKAIERAKQSDLLVQRTSIYRQYRVTNRATGAQYVVNFFVTVGKRYDTVPVRQESVTSLVSTWRQPQGFT